ncbi:hypothetical protein PUN28_018618 [Cardiocondyla obscurior]|uniref:Uncharacterized protein n=1 Tax=Cardiocondyla obscurior TaxID=286306 RepID=A0AAW2EG56_9HYME
MDLCKICILIKYYLNINIFLNKTKLQKPFLVTACPRNFRREGGLKINSKPFCATGWLLRQQLRIKFLAVNKYPSEFLSRRQVSRETSIVPCKFYAVASISPVPPAGSSLCEKFPANRDPRTRMSFHRAFSSLSPFSPSSLSLSARRLAREFVLLNVTHARHAARRTRKS